MGPKKGKKAGGLSEAAELKRKQELTEKFLQLKTSKEDAYQTLNANKLLFSWRRIMRQCKSEELNHDIEILSQAFERIIDRKESVIELLTEDIRLAELQHRMALGGHLDSINKLLTVQKDRMTNIQMEFMNELKGLQIEYKTSMNTIQDIHQKDMENMADLAFSLERTFTGIEQEYKSEFQSKKDEIRNKNNEERQQMKVGLEHIIEEIWSKMQETLTHFHANTEERKKAYETLRVKDVKSIQTIDQQMETIQKLTETIASLRGKIVQTTREQEEKNFSLIQDCEKMKKQFTVLKAHLLKIQKNHYVSLIQLTCLSNEVIEKLEEKVKEVEKIIRIGDVCSKYETESEKILPLYQSSYTDEEQNSVNEAVEAAFQSLPSHMQCELSSMENFWKRYNKVELDRLALQKEKADLMRENTELRNLLREYLENITIPEDALAKRNNNLMILKPPYQMPESFSSETFDDPRIRRRLTTPVVEASLVYQRSIV